MSDRVDAARLHVRARPHWINALVLLPAARPFARLDGIEYPMAWGEPLTVPMSAGQHRLETFLRYRGTRMDLGIGRLALTAAPGADLYVEARNGWANDMPLQPRLVAVAAT